METKGASKKLTVEELIARISAGVTSVLLKETGGRIDALEEKLEAMEQLLDALPSQMAQSEPASLPDQAATKAWVAGYVKEAVAERIPDTWVNRQWVQDYVNATVLSRSAPEADLATRTWVSGFVAREIGVRMTSDIPSTDWVRQYVDERLRATVTSSASDLPKSDWESSSGGE